MSKLCIICLFISAEMVNKGELKSLLKKGIVLNISIGLIMFFLAQISAPLISKIYVGYDAAVFNLSVHVLRVYAFVFLFQGVNEYSSAFFTGLNNGLVSGILAFSRTFILQIACVFILSLLVGIEGLWFAQVTAEIIAALIAVFFRTIDSHFSSLKVCYI